MTKLTLVVPTYNLSHYFDDTLATIAAQTEAFELWLIDDHSTDGTAEKAVQFANGIPMFHVEQFTAHQGVSAARNFGITHASGDAVAFVDGDDRLHPDYVKTLAQAFKPIHRQLRWGIVGGANHLINGIIMNKSPNELCFSKPAGTVRKLAVIFGTKPTHYRHCGNSSYSLTNH
nr:glycosyltransferase family A protein [Secundilactobacillus silagei]